MQSRRCNFPAFVLDNPGEMRAQGLCIHPRQVKPLTAAEHGHRDLANFGCGEDEFDVLWRLLQRLQQGVERVRESM